MAPALPACWFPPPLFWNATLRPPKPKSRTHLEECFAAAPDIEKSSMPCSLASTKADPALLPVSGCAVGERLVRLDGRRKVEGTEIFGADEIPSETLGLRVIRCPFDHAKFSFGDLQKFVAGHPFVQSVLTAKDVPGQDCYGVIPRFADQPIFAHEDIGARFRGEAVAAMVGDAEAP